MCSSIRFPSWRLLWAPDGPRFSCRVFLLPCQGLQFLESAIETPTPKAANPGSSRWLLASAGAALVLLWGASSWLPVDTPFSSDTGVRFLQVRELQAQAGIEFALRYHGRELDPGLRFVPWYYAFSDVGGRLLLHIPPWLPLAGVALEAVLGRGALWLAPILGSLLAALALAAWGARAGLRRPTLLFWFALLGSPLLFYSFVFWDHSWAAAWAAVACALLASTGSRARAGQALLAGAALGWATAQRPECLPFGLALGLAWTSLHWRSFRVLGLVVLGASLCFGMSCLINFGICGHPLGMGVAPHLVGYGQRRVIAEVAPSSAPVPTPAKVKNRVRVIGQLLFGEESFDRRRLFWLLMLAGLSCLLCARGRLRAACLALGTTLCVGAWGWLVYRAWGSEPVGLLSSVPLLPLVFWPLRKGVAPAALEGRRLAGRCVLLFLALMLTFWPAFGGFQWSSRYLLPATPLLLWLAWQQLDVWWKPGGRLLRVCAPLLLCLGVVLHTGLGFRHLLVQKREVAEYKRVIAGWSERVVITDRLFLPSFMTSLQGKDFFYFDDPAQREQLLQILQTAGETQVVVLEEGASFQPVHVRLR